MFTFSDYLIYIYVYPLQFKVYICNHVFEKIKLNMYSNEIYMMMMMMI